MTSSPKGPKHSPPPSSSSLNTNDKHTSGVQTDWVSCIRPCLARKRHKGDSHGKLTAVGTLPAPQPSIFGNIPEEEDEEHMCPILIEALESLELENLQFIDTSKDADDDAPYYKMWKPDISTYTSDFQLEDRHDPTYPIEPDSEATPPPTHISELLLPFELKRGKHDPFCDKPDEPDAEFESAAHVTTRGQIAAMLSEVLAYSFRTHVFFVFMDGYIARLLRADRAGVIVSAAFDYRTDSHLVDFLRRFDSAEPWQRGIDDTGNNLEVIQIPSTDPSSDPIEIRLEVDLPHTESLVSRGRRVAKVRNTNTGQYYFMKDGWRANVPKMTTEWLILTQLNNKNVPHIPKFVAGGDIARKYHRTVTDEYAAKEWRVGPKIPLTPRIHYRFIEEDVGKPLSEFKNAKELTQVLADVIEALQAAWENCGYLHRDVSSGNIMIQKGRGVLIDWEFAKTISSAGRGSLESGGIFDRTGTWAYMSDALLSIPGKQHSHLDDLQSVYWVLFEKALGYLKHDYPHMSRAAKCLTEYDPINQEGGDAKSKHLQRQAVIKFPGNAAFSELFYEFCGMMYFASVWETTRAEGQDPSKRRIRESDVPNHTTVLNLFRQALARTDGDHDWSEEREITDKFKDL